MWEISVPISIALVGVIVSIIKFVPSRDGKNGKAQCVLHTQFDKRLRDQETHAATVVERLNGISAVLDRLETGMGELFSLVRERRE